MEDQVALQMGEEIGFSHVGMVSAQVLCFREEVRDMCAADRCHMYGKSWTCPPGCGTIEEMAQQAKQYHRGILLQSTGQLEDDFDIETMQETEEIHKARFKAFVDWLRKEKPDCMPMGAGACQICPECTYPDAPCRFPKLAMPSMEACGLLVSQVCEQAGLPYYYGRQTMTYTSCALID